MPAEHRPLGHVPTLTANTFLSNGSLSMSSLDRPLTGSKHRTFGFCHTGVNWNCPPLLRLFSCCPEEEEEEEGLSLSLTVSNCRLWQRAVSIQAALLLRPPSAHVLPTSSGKLRPGSVAHHPSLLRPLNPNSKSNSMHFCHSRHK